MKQLSIRSLLAITLTLAFGAFADMRPFAPGEVRVGGEIGRRMDVTIDKMLHHMDVDKTFVNHFRNRKEKPDEPGGFAGYGMFLDGLVKAAAHGVGGEECVREKTRRLAELDELQSADGRITMYSGKPGGWDNHEGAYLIQALCLDHRVFGCKRSLATARRLADSLIADKAFCTLGSEPAYLMLYEETKDAKYLNWLKTVGGIHDDIGLYGRKLPMNGKEHVYTWIARALGQVEYADSLNVPIAERRMLTAAADEVFRRAKGPYMSITGSISGKPQWGEIWDATQAGLGKWGETCATAYLMRLAAHMMWSDPQAYYGDLFEQAMYNAFFSAQSNDGQKYRYWTPFNERAPWYDRDTYCCPNNYKREVFEIPDAVFYRLADGLAVNLYSDAELKAAGVTATMKTAYPEDGAVALDVTMKGRVLKLRIPAWCAGATVAVNGGAPVAAQPGWFTLTHDFSAKTHVDLNLPMAVRTVPGVRAQEGRYAIMRGPCVYTVAFTCGDRDMPAGDLWDLDFEEPMVWNASNRTVDVTLAYRNNGVRGHFSLVRYSSDYHHRTYLDPAPPVLKVGIVDPCPPPDGKRHAEVPYAQALEKVGHRPYMIFWTTNRAEIARQLENRHLVLFIGGEDFEPSLFGEKKSPLCENTNPRRDAFEKAVLDECVKRRLPVFGICRGEQFINCYFGGNLYQDIYSEVPGVSRHRYLAPQPRGYLEHDVEILGESRLMKVLNRPHVSAKTWHHQAVKRLAPGFRVAARTADGIVEAIESDYYPAAGVQFHPEQNVAKDPFTPLVEIFRELPFLCGAK